ncbi:MAG: hypothetical protein KC776_07170 [Myxococcales bacterium]|nr:hypothetical protein [Myxococcales bacterium]MCB9582257.1 hypothetical protein [Polyangiaceae bacterium]
MTKAVARAGDLDLDDESQFGRFVKLMDGVRGTEGRATFAAVLRSIHARHDYNAYAAAENA